MAIHSNILTGKTPCKEKAGRLQSMASQRVGHDRACTYHHLVDPEKDLLELSVED